MKFQLFLCVTLIASQLLYGQLPTGPDGKTLYQKGDCKTILPNVKYKCVFCEDKELTKNCKEYDCSLTECKESKSTKGSNGRMQAKPISIDGKQVRMRDDSDTTSKLPKGTKFENGKVVITNGYKAVQSSDKTMVFILADNGNNVEGSFSCKCFLGLGACGVIISGSAVGCSGAECCRFKVTTGNLSGLTMQDIERAPEKLKWKKLVLPVKSN